MSSLEAAVAFFRDGCGFRVADRGLNRGPEQARLDGLPAPVVDVLTLVPPGRPTPHLELLHYREPAFRGAAPAPVATWTLLGAGGPGSVRVPTRLDAPDDHGLVTMPP